jgi:hypothetical protein
LTRTPPAWRLAERMLRGELTSPRGATGVLRLPAKALKALAA